MASRIARKEWMRGLPSAIGEGRYERKLVHSASERSVGYVFLIEESVQNHPNPHPYQTGSETLRHLAYLLCRAVEHYNRSGGTWSAEAREVSELPAQPLLEPQPRLLGTSAQGTEGDHVRVAEDLAYDQTTIRLQDPTQFAQGGVLIRYFPEGHCHVGGVEGVVGVG